MCKKFFFGRYLFSEKPCGLEDITEKFGHMQRLKQLNKNAQKVLK